MKLSTVRKVMKASSDNQAVRMRTTMKNATESAGNTHLPRPWKSTERRACGGLSGRAVVLGFLGGRAAVLCFLEALFMARMSLLDFDAGLSSPNRDPVGPPCWPNPCAGFSPQKDTSTEVP